MFVNSRKRRGFTLIELLVVMTIIGVLVALILPAVQQAREAARRMQCKSNVKQLLLAMHNYEEVHRVFPLSYARGPAPYGSSEIGVSWMQMILPMIDQGNLYSALRFGQPLAHPANTLVAQTAVPLYLCPSDSNDGRMDFRSNVPGLWGVNNYKACSGSNWAWGAFSPVVSTAGRNANNPDGLDHGNGLICRGGGNRPTTTRMADVTDGTAHTFAVGEAVPLWSRHTWWYWFNATTGTCAIPLNFKMQPDRQVSGEGDWAQNYSFLSRHTGGGHFGMVDGSARFVSENIDLFLYRRLGTIQGAEVVNDF